MKKKSKLKNGILRLLITSLLMNMEPSIAQTTWQLVWSDEFSGTLLDGAKWSPEFGNGGWGNNESQYYTNATENLAVENGQLVITARHEGSGATEYTSARIITKDHYEFQYGKVEARMKLPMGQGFWPAFWMIGANIDDVSWPACGEIDIMEQVSNEYSTHGTVHWNNNGHVYLGNGYNVDPTQYHVYGIIWEDNLIRWYVDGIQFYQFTVQPSNNSDDGFGHPFFLILNLAIGGNWPGYPDASTLFPSSMMVDYVRVYQPASTVYVNDVVGSDLSVYPVPSRDVVQITAPDALISCILRSVDGQLISDLGKQPAQTSLALTDIPAGFYLLECTWNGGHAVKSLVKE